MADKNIFRVSPFRIFVAVVVISITAATIFQYFSQKTVFITDSVEERPRELSELDLDGLRAEFYRIKSAGGEVRWSTVLALNKRIEIARLILDKSRSDADLASGRRILVQSLLNKAAYQKTNGLEFRDLRSEASGLLHQSCQIETGQDKRKSLHSAIELAVDDLLNDLDDEETIPRVIGYLGIIEKEFPDFEMAALVERALLKLTLDCSRTEVIETVIGAAASTYDSNPDPRLSAWSRKLTDDIEFRKLELFRIFDNIIRGRKSGPADFVAVLPGLLDRDGLSESAFERIVSLARDTESVGAYSSAIEAAGMIKQHLKRLPETEFLARQIRELDSLLVRSGNIGSEVALNIVDVQGKSLIIKGDGAGTFGSILGIVVSSAREFKEIHDKHLDAVSMDSRGIALAVVCPGMSPEEVRKQFAEFADLPIFLIADPERNSDIYKLCPAEITPVTWIVSREHKLIHVNVREKNLAREIESLMFAR